MLTDLTDSIAIKRAIEKVVDERIAQITKECLRTYKAQIVSKTSTKMNVRLIGDISSVISVPYSTAVANSNVGDYIFVATTYDSFRNAVAWLPVDLSVDTPVDIVDIGASSSGTFTDEQYARLENGAMIRTAINSSSSLFQFSNEDNYTKWYYSFSQDFFTRSTIAITKSSKSYTVSTTFGLVKETMMTAGRQLYFELNTMYAVQCFDTSRNLADFTIVGGSKDGATGRFAFVFVGDKMHESLILYQTGSIVISNLAATSGASTGIKPSASTSKIRYFKIGGA